MKRFIFLALLLISVMVFAADPTFEYYSSPVGDIVVDSNWDTDNWEPVGSLIVTASDTGYVTLTITGTAYILPWERLYLGLGNDSANRVDSATSATTGQTHTNIDTNLVRGNPNWQTEVYLPFIWQERVSMDSAQVDTFYWNLATEGGDIELYNVMVSAQISDR